MATFTLTNEAVFPEGTTVGAYPVADWTNEDVVTGAAPPGTATNEQTMTSGSLTFAGLADSTQYVAYALVGSNHRYLRIRTATPAVEADSVTAAELAADSVGSSEIAAGAVGTSEVAADSLGAGDLGADSVDASEIAADAVRASEIQAGAVGTSEISDGTVSNADLASNAAIAVSKLAQPTLGTRLWGPAAGPLGGATLPANALYYQEVNIPWTTTITGGSYCVGATSAGSVRSALYDSTGARVANRTTNKAAGGTQAVDDVAFDTPYVAVPGVYFIAIIFSDAAHTAYFGVSGNRASGAVQGGFTTPASITVPAATQYVPILGTH